MTSASRFLSGLLASALLSGCALFGGAPAVPDPQFDTVRYKDLPDWPPVGMSAQLAHQAMSKSCARLVTLPADRSLGAEARMGLVGNWQPFCRAVLASTPATFPALVQANLVPWEVANGRETEGLFTGYYVSSLYGSRTRHGPFQTPLYRLPPDDLKVDASTFPSRTAIVSGALAGRGLELVWVTDPVDAFFVQIQGSGTVELDTGEKIHLSYAGKNGHPYRAIGAELVAMGEMEKDDVSMPAIRDWLEANPSRAASLLNTNPSYVFFREDPEALTAGAQGAARVGLTPLASLAVDNRFIGYHVPLWVDIEDPRYDDKALRGLMVAQDTGGAIKGVVRADVFWGHGPEAEAAAGVMKSKGRYYVLLPQGVDPRLPKRPQS